MLEKFIKKDRNEILENVLAQKDVDERTKNLLQGILYKIDVSYKDYQNAKVIQRNKKEYVDEINKNIKRKCNKIVTVSFNEKIEEEKIKKSLEKNKFYIDENQIITYPIEEKILYAIEKSINNNKIVNSKYEIISEPLSNLIMTGKSLDRVEVLRDFNGWSWTTIKTEIESISSNLVYQILQILLGEEFMDNWSFDTDGIIDYYSMFKEQISNKYGIENAKKLYEIIEKIAIMNEIEQDIDFKSEKIQQLNEIDNDIKKRTNVEQYITELTEEKKKAEKEIADMATRSIQLNNLQKKFDILNCNIKDIDKLLKINSYDAIVTNPPYKKPNSGKINENKTKLISRHEIEATLDDFIRISFKMLKDKGKLYMVHRAERIVDILSTMRKYKIEPKRIRFVFSNPNSESKLVLIEATKNAKSFVKIEKPLYVYNESGHYTQEILQIYNK